MAAATTGHDDAAHWVRRWLPAGLSTDATELVLRATHKSSGGELIECGTRLYRLPGRLPATATATDRIQCYRQLATAATTGEPR